MTRDRPFRAVIFDMDGVLTRTASLHQQAWKRMFDDFLQKQDNQRPFSSADYRAHVDGKPRYQGVEDFLRSRQLELPRGDPSDASDKDTVSGLGKRKNELFLQLLEREGVEVFDDAVAALARWRRGGMKLAVVSSSRNCRRVLRAADLERRFDVIVDGQVAAEEDLGGKPGIMIEAARRLGVEPSNTVVLEDATAGVRAARKHRFGLVVGVSRSGNDSDLQQAGADVVVSDAYRVRFLRWIPNALERMEEISTWRGRRPLAICLDFDGTLAPVVDDPRNARIAEGMRSALEHLRCPVAIISGRDRKDIESRVGIEGIFYAGNHGFDKGRALQWLADVLPTSTPDPPFIVYVGADETDEDAFAANRGNGCGVRVGDSIAASLADYQLSGPEQVRELLSSLADHGTPMPSR